MHFEAKFPPGAAAFRALIAGMKNLTTHTNLYCTTTFPQSSGAPAAANAAAAAGPPQPSAATAADAAYGPSSSSPAGAPGASAVPPRRVPAAEGGAGGGARAAAANDDEGTDGSGGSGGAVVGPGIQVQFMDSLASKALVAWQLHRDAFSSITLEREIVVIGIRPSELHKYLGHVREDDTLTLRADTDALGVADLYELYIESADLTRKCLYEIDCVRQNDTLTVLPVTSYHASIRMSAPEFDRAVRSMFEVSSNVSITVGPTSVTFLASGQTSSLQIGLVQKQQTLPTPRGSPTAETHASDGDDNQAQSGAGLAGGTTVVGSFSVCHFHSRLSQTFDAKYLMTLCSAAIECSDNVVLHLCRGAPMKVVFDVTENQPSVRDEATSQADVREQASKKEGGEGNKEAGQANARVKSPSAAGVVRAKKGKVGQVQFYLASEEAYA